MTPADRTAMMRIAALRNDLDGASMMLKPPIAAKLLEAYHQVLQGLCMRVAAIEAATAAPEARRVN